MIAVITGATGAIGQQICREFARHGIDVAVCYNRREAEAQALAAELARSVRAVAVGLSLEDPTSIARAFDYIHSVFGHVDYLVNNAGISLIKPLLDTTPDEWQRMLAVNLTSAYYTCRQVLPKMYHTGGSILNVSSMWGSLGASCEVAYATAKAGLICPAVPPPAKRICIQLTSQTLYVFSSELDREIERTTPISASKIISAVPP